MKCNEYEYQYVKKQGPRAENLIIALKRLHYQSVPQFSTDRFVAARILPRSFRDKAHSRMGHLYEEKQGVYKCHKILAGSIRTVANYVQRTITDLKQLNINHAEFS